MGATFTTTPKYISREAGVTISKTNEHNSKNKTISIYKCSITLNWTGAHGFIISYLVSYLCSRYELKAMDLDVNDTFLFHADRFIVYLYIYVEFLKSIYSIFQDFNFCILQRRTFSLMTCWDHKEKDIATEMLPFSGRSHRLAFRWLMENIFNSEWKNKKMKKGKKREYLPKRRDFPTANSFILECSTSGCNKEENACIQTNTKFHIRIISIGWAEAKKNACSPSGILT